MCAYKVHSCALDQCHFNNSVQKAKNVSKFSSNTLALRDMLIRISAIMSITLRAPQSKKSHNPPFLLSDSAPLTLPLIFHSSSMSTSVYFPLAHAEPRNTNTGTIPEVDGCHLCVLSLFQEPAMQITPLCIFMKDLSWKERAREF